MRKLLVLVLLQCNLFLIDLRLTKCVIKLSILIYFYLILFLIDISLRNGEARLLSEDPFILKYCPDKHQSQKCVINSCLNVLKFVSVWFVTFEAYV